MTNFKRPIIQQSIADFNSIYQKAQRPILIWDTCSLLDIIRLPIGTKLNLNLDSLKAIIQLQNDFSANKIYSICSNLTTIEWDEHIEKIIIEVEKYIELNFKYYAKISELHNYLYNLTHSPIIAKKIVSNFSDFADRIINETIVLETYEISDLALNRAANRRRPSTSGKNEFKDCAIWETAIAVAKIVNGKSKVALFSTNDSDYLDKSSMKHKLHPDLASEAALAKLEFCYAFNEVANCFGYKF